VFVCNDEDQRRNARRESTRGAVRRLKDAGLSQAEIARELGLTKGAIAYHFRSLGSEPDERFARRYDWAVIQAAYDTGLSVRACARRFGFNTASWHGAVARGDIVPRPQETPIEELLVAGKKRGRDNLKRRLLAAGLKENRCENCAISRWRGRELRMELHHVNGDGLDNRLENLCLLCPNCHAQTETYGRRNGRRRRRVRDERS
jgi:AcrR family transcriptional regulator